MRTAAWYGDSPLHLDFPPDWEVRILWPGTPAPLPASAIGEALDNPIGQDPIRELAKGKRRPVVIIDDLNRPTPTDRILPFVLARFPDPGKVTIVVATGTHGPPAPGAVERKTGGAGCRTVVHDPHGGELNEEVAASDFVIGIGGIYPNHTAGFGGGSKLALGVLGFRQIQALHYRHGSAGWGGCAQNSFRSEMDQIARRIGLRTVLSVQVDADRELVRVVAGDHFLYHADETAFARLVLGAPEPSAADVVVSNAYPNDLSLTFAEMKGMTPLSRCAAGVSRVAIASCPEGMGFHALFSPENKSGQHRLEAAWRKLALIGPRAAAARLARRVHRRRATASLNRVWIYRPGQHSATLPEQTARLRISNSWPRILDAVRAEHPGETKLRVLIYPCAPLQSLTRGDSAGGADNHGISNATHA